MNSLECAIENFGNPFEDSGSEHMVLNSRTCVHETVIETVQAIEMIAKKQYQDYYEVILKRTSSIHDTIKKNRLPLFKLQNQRSNPSLPSS